MRTRLFATILFLASTPALAQTSSDLNIAALSDKEVSDSFLQVRRERAALATRMAGILAPACRNSTIHTLVAGVPILANLLHPISALRGKAKQARQLASLEQDPRACLEAIGRYENDKIEYARLSEREKRLSDEDALRIRRREREIQEHERRRRIHPVGRLSDADPAGGAADPAI